MSKKLPALVPDDPTRAVPGPEPVPESGRPSETTEPATPAAQTPGGRSRARGARRPAPAAPAAPDSADVDGEWSGATDVTTIRVPTELLRLLRRRSRELGLPIGMIVTTGLVDALSAADEDLTERVDATQGRYDQARRRASRAA